MTIDEVVKDEEIKPIPESMFQKDGVSFYPWDTTNGYTELPDECLVNNRRTKILYRWKWERNKPYFRYDRNNDILYLWNMGSISLAVIHVKLANILYNEFELYETPK